MLIVSAAGYGTGRFNSRLHSRADAALRTQFARELGEDRGESDLMAALKPGGGRRGGRG